MAAALKATAAETIKHSNAMKTDSNVKERSPRDAANWDTELPADWDIDLLENWQWDIDLSTDWDIELPDWDVELPDWDIELPENWS